MATRRPYSELVLQAGFGDIIEIDVTAAYARTQRAWNEAIDSRAVELRRLTSDTDFAANQADRQLTLAAILEGLLRRSLFIAAKPKPSIQTNA